jgi:hypothetical protein
VAALLLPDTGRRSPMAKITSRIIRMDMLRVTGVSILAASGAMNTMGASGMVAVTTMGIGSTPAEEGTDMAAELGWVVATAGMAAVTAAGMAAATVNILVPGEKESADLQNITAGRTRTAAINRESVHGCA